MPLFDDSPDMMMSIIRLFLFFAISTIYGVTFLLHLFTSFTMPDHFLLLGKMLGTVWILGALYLVLVYVTAPELSEKEVEK